MYLFIGLLPPKGLQEAAYTPKAISDRLVKGVDSSLTNDSRLYTCKYRHAYTLLIIMTRVLLNYP